MAFYKDHLNFDGFKTHCIGTEYKYSIWPRRCHISGKWILFEHAFKQTAMWTGPGDPIFEHRWYNKDIFLVNRLKDEV